MNLEQYYLMQLAEEANEVAQRALKAAQFGLSEVQEGQDYSNSERLIQEINDFEVIVYLLNSDFSLGHEKLHSHRLQKLKKLSKYYEYSKTLGKVQDE